jgi:undecaprenyl-diphosphatase
VTEVNFTPGLQSATDLARARSLGGLDISEPDQRMAYLALVATIPASVVSFWFEDILATMVRSLWIVVGNLGLVGALFIVVEATGCKSQ